MGLRPPRAGPSASTAKFSCIVKIDGVREVQRPTFTFAFRDSPLSPTWLGHPNDRSGRRDVLRIRSAPMRARCLGRRRYRESPLRASPSRCMECSRRVVSTAPLAPIGCPCAMTAARPRRQSAAWTSPNRPAVTAGPSRPAQAAVTRTAWTATRRSRMDCTPPGQSARATPR